MQTYALIANRLRIASLLERAMKRPTLKEYDKLLSECLTGPEVFAVMMAQGAKAREKRRGR